MAGAMTTNVMSLVRANSTELPPVALVQLPFPSQSDPLPALAAYYDAYNREYAKLFPEYAVKTGDLWEAPLWVAHMDGAIGRPDTQLIDLSRARFVVEDCVGEIVERVAPPTLIFFSPLAQNFSLAAAVSRHLISRGYRTVVGGNMSEFASLKDFSTTHSGIVRQGIYATLTSSPGETIVNNPRRGKQAEPIGYAPTYRLLQHFAGRVPLVRLNASHGCLLACSFCGDAWSRQLHLVDRTRLEAEVIEVRRTFPNTKIIYIGDKTFGQSEAAIQNLIHVIRPEYGFRLIVQTHVSLISPKLIDSMSTLGVEVVELGFESASSSVLRELCKHGGAEIYRDALKMLHASGLHVILNILGGLPNETSESHAATVRFLEATADDVWLYNLYNFVPYPKTPLYQGLKDRIVDWDFRNWREDQPVVFTPYTQTREASWKQFLTLVECATALIEKRATPTLNT